MFKGVDRVKYIRLVGVPKIQQKNKCTATADYSKIQIIPRTSSIERESSRDFL